jgi:hypothetical protein
MMHRGLRTIERCVVVVFIVGCSGADADADWAGTIETLPNGVVRVTNPTAGLWSADNGWQLDEELVLGDEDGEGPAVFGSVSGLEVDDAGNIYVLDRQSNDLRIFDASGTHVRTVGRAGEGPGEYSAANGLAWLSPDTLIVVDQRGNRYSLLNRDGEYVRSVRRLLPFYGWAFGGGMDGDVIYETYSVSRGEDRVPALLGTRLRGDDVEVDAAIDAASAETAPRFAADTILLAPPDGPLYESFSIRTKQGGMVMGVPFAGTPEYRLDRDGGIWSGHGGSPALLHASLRGDTLMHVLLAIEPVPVTPEEVDVWLESPGIDQFKAMGGNLDLGRIPKTKPYFDEIVLDDEGNVWLAVPSSPQSTVFAVLDSTGRYLGQLRIDGVAREPYVSPVVRNGRLYFIGRDDLDVQRVYVHRIEQSGAAARRQRTG